MVLTTSASRLSGGVLSSMTLFVEPVIFQRITNDVAASSITKGAVLLLPAPEKDPTCFGRGTVGGGGGTVVVVGTSVVVVGGSVARVVVGTSVVSVVSVASVVVVALLAPAAAPI